MLVLSFFSKMYAGLIMDPVILSDDTSQKLENAIKYTSQKQAIYSYNIANATTPGFEVILPLEDQQEILNLIDVDNNDQEYLKKVMIEHIMAKIAENNKRQQALYTLYKKRFENMRTVVKLGK